MEFQDPPSSPPMSQLHATCNVTPSPTIPSSPLSNLPTIPNSASQSMKPKAAPTVTPRRFTRFFNPRFVPSRRSNRKPLRQALNDVTSTAANESGRFKRRRIDKSLFGQGSGEYEIAIGDVAGDKENQTGLLTPEPSSQLCSPQRANGPSRRQIDDKVTLAEEEDVEGEPTVKLPPIIRSRYRGQLGGTLRRETAEPCLRSRRERVMLRADWQDETSNFYSTPNERYQCITPQSASGICIPFSVASCHTNTLVAVGNEYGGISILETEQHSNSTFSRAYLDFQSSNNAIIDMAFSPDDLILATACGDHLSHIIDMPTQRTVCVLAGHTGTIKQIRFQPFSSSNKILATSCRDGEVLIYDLRCSSSQGMTPVTRFDTDSLAGGGAGRIKIDAPLRFHNPIDKLHDPHGQTTSKRQLSERSKGSRRSTIVRLSSQPTKLNVSITCLAFLRKPHQSHLLVTASEADAHIKLWDLRYKHSSRYGPECPTPVSTTQQPESHRHTRQYGTNSLVFNIRGDRLFALCRDNTIYAYSVPHLVLGSDGSSGMDAGREKSEINSSTASDIARRSRRSRTMTERGSQGLGPIFAFRHKDLSLSSFYEKLAIRESKDDRSELLAVGGRSGKPIVFCTDESRIFSKPEKRNRTEAICEDEEEEEEEASMGPRSSLQKAPGSSRSAAGARRSPSSMNPEAILTTSNGTTLHGGHQAAVTDLTWTYNGELVSASDDLTVRLWREDGDNVRTMRRRAAGGQDENGLRGIVGCGWAEREEDDEDRK
ncbi:hypothetical protein MMC25_004887 [Agyrium rufum]|nr:hypothetical protein [Agyrium rufum]